MIINHNITALNTLNRLQKNNKSASSAMEKLSSGIRINKAADDVAGLAISEKMRSQIKGLEQVERNIQDGIALLQVADSALGEIQDLNQRMRELTIQGSSDILTSQDRESIQAELNQLKKGIEDISTKTQFNSIQLIDGSLELDPNPKSPLGFEWKVNFASPIQLTSIAPTSDGGMIIGGTNDVNGSEHNINDRSPYLVKLDSEGQVEWELKIPKDGEYNIVYDIKKLDNKDEYILTTRSWTGSGSNENIFYRVDGDGNILAKIDNGYMNYSHSINQNEDGTFVETGLGGGKIFVRTYDSNFNAIKYKTYNGPPDSVSSGFDIKKTSDGGYILAGMENNKTTDDFGILMKLNSDLTIQWQKAIKDEDFSSVVENENGEFLVLGKDLYKFDANGNNQTINDEIGYSIDPFLLSAGNIIETNDGNYLLTSGASSSASFQNKVTKIDQAAQEIWSIAIDNDTFRLAAVMELVNGDYIALGENEVFKYTSDSYKAIDHTLHIQTGVRSGNSVGINIDNMEPQHLGYRDDIPSVLTNEAASLSIRKIDDAIEKVSRNRSKLGALQNGLEHSLQNSSNYKENITAAESRIRDTDMAKETMEMSKNQILSQAAQAMLSQASQQPQQILQLLK